MLDGETVSTVLDGAAVVVASVVAVVVAWI